MHPEFNSLSANWEETGSRGDMAALQSAARAVANNPASLQQLWRGLQQRRFANAGEAISARLAVFRIVADQDSRPVALPPFLVHLEMMTECGGHGTPGDIALAVKRYGQHDGAIAALWRGAAGRLPIRHRDYERQAAAIATAVVSHERDPAQLYSSATRQAILKFTGGYGSGADIARAAAVYGTQPSCVECLWTGAKSRMTASYAVFREQATAIAEEMLRQEKNPAGCLTQGAKKEALEFIGAQGSAGMISDAVRAYGRDGGLQALNGGAQQRAPASYEDCLRQKLLIADALLAQFQPLEPGADLRDIKPFLHILGEKGGTPRIVSAVTLALRHEEALSALFTGAEARLLVNFADSLSQQLAIARQIVAQEKAPRLLARSPARQKALAVIGQHGQEDDITRAVARYYHAAGLRDALEAGAARSASATQRDRQMSHIDQAFCMPPPPKPVHDIDVSLPSAPARRPATFRRK